MLIHTHTELLLLSRAILTFSFYGHAGVSGGCIQMCPVSFMREFNWRFQICPFCGHRASLPESQRRFREDKSSPWSQLGEALHVRALEPHWLWMGDACQPWSHQDSGRPWEPDHVHCACHFGSLFKALPPPHGGPLTLSHSASVAWGHETTFALLWPCQGRLPHLLTYQGPQEYAQLFTTRLGICTSI